MLQIRFPASVRPSLRLSVVKCCKREWNGGGGPGPLNGGGLSLDKLSVGAPRIPSYAVDRGGGSS